jgi:uncharacterized membrane protein YczE
MARFVLEKVFKFHWMGWRRFAYGFLVIQIGFLLIGLAVDIMVQANLGLSPWDVLHMGLTYHLPISLGEATIWVGLTIILLDIVLGERVGWGTITNMLFIGLWIDALRPLVPTVPTIFYFQIAWLLLATLIMGFGTAIYVGVDAGAGPRDSLMLALTRIFRMKIRWSRTLLEVTAVVIGWFLGGPFWLGTFISAFTIGPAIQLAFKVLRIEKRNTDLIIH